MAAGRPRARLIGLGSRPRLVDGPRLIDLGSRPRLVDGPTLTDLGSRPRWVDLRWRDLNICVRRIIIF